MGEKQFRKLKLNYEVEKIKKFAFTPNFEFHLSTTYYFLTLGILNIVC